MFEKEAIRHAFEATIGVECLNKPIEDFTYEELSDKLQEKADDYQNGAEFGYNELRDQIAWRVDVPPKNKKIELLCVLFDEDEYRTLQKNSWNDEYNRFIITGTWNGTYFRGEIKHASGDPFPNVVAWRPMEEQNLGAPFYTKCLGECRD